MSEQCPFCVEARTEAAKPVHKWLERQMHARVLPPNQ